MENPTRTVPRALAGAVVLVILAYLVPLLVALGVTVEGTGWELGYFTYVADKARRCYTAVTWWSRLVAVCHKTQPGGRHVAGLLDHRSCGGEPDWAVPGGDVE